MFDVFFYEAFEEESEALKRVLPPTVAAGYTPKTIQEQADPEPPAGLISIRTQSKIPLEWAGRLAGILTRSTGFDHVKLYRELTRASLPCGFLPLYCARAVAEHAMMMWTALLRRYPAQARQFMTFHRDGLTGRECLGKTVAVIGVGNIGIEVVRIARGLGMNPLGVDIVHRHADVTYVNAEEALRQADVIVCSMNLTAANRGYFNAERFQQVKPDAVFVNIARGELSPAQDLLGALNAGRLSGVGLDVYDNESLLAVSLRSGTPADDPSVRAVLELRERPNVILTPHNAFNTLEAVERKSAQSAEQIAAFLAKRAFLWPVPE